jgi:hypothetical protein
MADIEARPAQRDFCGGSLQINPEACRTLKQIVIAGL